MSKDSSSRKLQDNLASINSFEKTNGVTLKKPRDYSIELSDSHKYQLILSKLYAGNDKCAAIYVQTDGKALVSNNTGN